METIINLLKEFFPKFFEKNKFRLLLSIITVALCFYIFNSNSYKLWRYYDDNYVQIITRALPFPSKENSKIHYKFLIFLYKKHSSAINIENINIEFQTRQFISNYKIELNDIGKELIKTDIIKASNLICQIKEIDANKAFAISIDTYTNTKYMFESDAATVNLNYQIFSKNVSKFVHINPHSGNIHVPNRNDVVFDVFELIDHRKNPKFHFTYDYCKYTDKSGEKQIRVYCSDSKKKYLRVQHTDLSGSIDFESTNSIHTDFDPIRIQTLSNGLMNIYAEGLGPFRILELSNYYKKGLEYTGKNDFINAEKEFKKIIDSDPSDYQSWFNYGLCKSYLNKNDLAISALKKAIEAKGDYVKAYGQLGVSLIKKCDYLEAEKAIRKSIELNPKYAFGYYNLSIIQKNQGAIDDALNNLKLSIKYENDPKMKKKYERFLNEF